MPNPMTNTYAGLKGWQWAALVGMGGGLWIYLRSRNSAAQSSNATTPDTNAANPSGNPLQTIIEQVGPPSVTVNLPGAGVTTAKTSPAAPTPKPPVRPGSNVGLPNLKPSSFPIDIAARNAPVIPIPKGSSVTNGAPVYALVQTKLGPVYEQGAPVAAAQRAGRQLYTLSSLKRYIRTPPKPVKR